MCVVIRIFCISANAGDAKLPISSFVPTPQQPAIQFFEKVDPGSVADKAGIKAGDFVLEVNNSCLKLNNCIHLFKPNFVAILNLSVTYKVLFFAQRNDMNAGTLKSLLILYHCC